MSAQVIPAKPDADLARMTDAELTEVVLTEHGLCEEGLAQIRKISCSTLPHAVRAGCALLALRKRCDRKSWSAWLEAHPSISRSTASRYMRFAFYGDQLTPILETGTQADAHDMLVGLPHPQKVIRLAKVKALKEKGLTQKEIAQIVGLSSSGVSLLLNPTEGRRRAERARRAKRASRALAREERASEVKSAGGAPAEAYALLRKAAVALDAILADMPAGAGVARERNQWGSARAQVHKAEDSIVKALRISRELT